MNKVLIIEPSNTFAQFAKYALTRLGYEISHIQTATETLDQIKHIMPNLIISETTLRDISGLELCERIKQDSMLRNIPFVFITTDGIEETKLKAKDAGCTDYLMKPVTVVELHELMQHHLPFHQKRLHIRAKLHVKATIDDGEKLQEMKTLTRGEGGLYLISKNPYKIGSKLTIILPLPSLNSPLMIQGEVIYINDNSEAGSAQGMGIKFIGLSQKMEDKLSHYVRSYLSNMLSESPSIE